MVRLAEADVSNRRDTGQVQSLAEAITALVDGFTIETTPGSAAKIPDYRAHLRSGTSVAVTV